MKTLSVKSDGVTNMTEGNIRKLILEFAMPILLSQLFQQLYNTADSLIVGRYLGTEALAAVGSSGNLIFLLTSFFIGTSTGAGVVISKYFGANDEKNVKKAIRTTISIGYLCGILLTVIGVAFTPLFLKWMRTDPLVMPQAVEYFRYYFFGVIAIVQYNNCKSIMNALGDSAHPLYYLVLSSLLNIFLDLLFIRSFGWGVWSAAVATVISQLASMVLCFMHLGKPGTIYQSKWNSLEFDRKITGEIIRMGFPAGIQNSVIGFANVIVQTNINSFGGLATAGYGAYTKIEGFAFLPVTSFNMAVTTFVSQNLGAREYKRAKKGASFGIFSCVFLAEMIGIVMYLTMPSLVGMFSSNPDVIAIGAAQGRTVTLFYCLLAYAHSIAAVCRGSGKAMVPMVVMLAIWCVLRIAYITIIMRIRHEIGYIFWAYPLTWSISCVIFFLYYHFSDWIHGFET